MRRLCTFCLAWTYFPDRGALRRKTGLCVDCFKVRQATVNYSCTECDDGRCLATEAVCKRCRVSQPSRFAPLRTEVRDD